MTFMITKKNTKPIDISSPLTKGVDYKLRISWVCEDFQDYESCKEHKDINVLHSNSLDCYACRRDHLLLTQLRGLADLFRDTEAQRERGEECINSLKQELDKSS